LTFITPTSSGNEDPDTFSRKHSTDREARYGGFQEQVATRRSDFYRELAAGPFYGFNRPGVESSEAIIENWWRQGMTGGAKAHYDGIVAFSQTDFTEDLKKISVPVLVMHGDADLLAFIRS
jgi:non-heme chloroperoxidase